MNRPGFHLDSPSVIDYSYYLNHADTASARVSDLDGAPRLPGIAPVTRRKLRHLSQFPSPPRRAPKIRPGVCGWVCKPASPEWPLHIYPLPMHSVCARRRCCAMQRATRFCRTARSDLKTEPGKNKRVAPIYRPKGAFCLRFVGITARKAPPSLGLEGCPKAPLHAPEGLLKATIRQCSGQFQEVTAAEPAYYPAICITTHNRPNRPIGGQ
jgi:hypothetical protein